MRRVDKIVYNFDSSKLLHGAAIDSSVVSSNKSSRHSQDQKGVVQHLGGVVRLSPEEDEVHQGRHDEGQEGAAAGPDQGHRLTKVGNSDYYQSG